MKQWREAEEVILRGVQLFPEDQTLLRIRADIERETSRSLLQFAPELHLAHAQADWL
jgi:hypothetical protein